MKPFFVHYHVPPGKWHKRRPRGFTIFVSEGETKEEVNIQLTFCSSQDVWVRKEGRSWAAKAELIPINKNKLAHFVATCYGVVQYGKVFPPSDINVETWSYLNKYVDQKV